nr:hypothetical protein [uncultured bacterium]
MKYFLASLCLISGAAAQCEDLSASFEKEKKQSQAIAVANEKIIKQSTIIECEGAVKEDMLYFRLKDDLYRQSIGSDKIIKIAKGKSGKFSWKEPRFLGTYPDTIMSWQLVQRSESEYDLFTKYPQLGIRKGVCRTRMDLPK